MKLKQLSIQHTGNDNCPFGIWKIQELKETKNGVEWVCPVCKENNITTQTFSTVCKICKTKCCG